MRRRARIPAFGLILLGFSFTEIPAQDASRHPDIVSPPGGRALWPASYERSGSYPWATILCALPDAPERPVTRETMHALLGDGYGRMNHFFREISYGKIDLEGSRTFGWVTLSQPRSAYVGIHELGVACLAALDVDLSGFYGINFVFNVGLEHEGFGGYGPFQLLGQRSLGVTWTSGSSYPWNKLLLARVMGFGFGMPHTNDEYGVVHGSPWDFVSAGYMGLESGDLLPINTVGPQKKRLGWIPPTGMRVITEDVARVLLENLSKPENPSGVHVVEIPYPGGVLMLEARARVGYDAHPTGESTIFGEGIVVHRIDPQTNPNFSAGRVVDFDGNRSAFDLGSILEVGESAVDSLAAWRIEVTRRVGLGFETVLTRIPTYAATVSVSGNGSVASAPTGLQCPPACAHDFPVRSSVVLRATPAPGWLFSEWSALCERDVECGMEMGWHRSTEARFVPAPDVVAAADELLGLDAMSESDVRLLDQNGNRNGFFDIGDFVALLGSGP